MWAYPAFREHSLLAQETLNIHSFNVEGSGMSEKKEERRKTTGDGIVRHPEKVAVE